MGPAANRERLLLVGAIVAAAVAGLGFRAWHLFADPLWLDEAYSAFAADHDFTFLWRVVPRYETHPPFYYALLRCWTLAFGDGLPALRVPGLVFGLATPPLIARAAVRASELLGLAVDRRRRLGVATFVLACLSGPLIEMTRQVRPYALMILVYALALNMLLALACRRRDGRPLASLAYLGYLLLAEAMLWLHSLGPLWAAALVPALLAAVAGRSLSRADCAWLALGHLALLLAWMPAVAILRAQAPTWIASTWVTFSWPNLWRRLATLYAVAGWPATAAAVLALLGTAAAWRGNEGRRVLAMLLLLGLVPTLLSIGISLAVAPVFLARTLAPVAVPTLVLLGLGAAAWQGRPGLAGAAAAATLAANLIAVDLQARAAGPMQDWYAAVRWLQPRLGRHDLILAYPNEGALPLQRALRDRGLRWPIRAVPAPVPAFGQGGWYPTGNRGAVSLPAVRLRGIAASRREVRTVWLLRLGAGGYDRGDAFLRILAAERRPVARYRDGAIDIVGLVTPSPAPDRSRR